MATISTLAVNLIARTSAFERGMKRGRKSVKSLGATVNGVVGTVARLAKGLAVAAGIGGIGFMLKRTLSTIDAIAKMSKELQISTEALMTLDQAAKLSGTSIEQVQKGLQIMVRRLGEAREGYGEGKKGLDAMGVSAQKMIDMGTEKAFLKIADAVKESRTAAEKANIAYQLFGRSGVNMINLLNEGSAGFIKLKKAMIEAGNTVSAFDAQKIEDANDAIVDLKTSMQGVVNQAVVRLAPAIEKAAELLTKYKDRIVSTVKNTVIFVVKTLLVIKTIKLVGGAIRGLIGIYKSLAAAQTVTLALGGPAGWATLAAGVIIATGAIIGMNKAIDGTMLGLDKLTGRQPQLKDESALKEEIAQKERILVILRQHEFATKKIETNEIARAILSLLRSEDKLKALQKENAATQALLDADRKIRKEQERLLVLERESERVIKSLLTPAQKLKAEIKLINELYKKGLITTNQLFAATRKVSLGSLVGDAEKLKQSLKTPLEILEDQAKKIGALFNAALITQEEFNKATAKIDKEKLALGGGEITGGRFQEIRSEFIDVAALNAGKSTRGIDKSNELAEKANFILQQIRNQGEGTAIL
jgi:hypothetical protein